MRIADDVRDAAATICAVKASAWHARSLAVALTKTRDVAELLDGVDAPDRAARVAFLAGAEATRVTGVPWLVWAEAESLLRSGWTPGGGR